MTIQLLSQQLGIYNGIQRHESTSETRREVGNRLLDATLSTSDLSSVSTEEVIHGLLSGQLADRRQHTISITCQEDDGLRMTCHTVLLVVGNVIDRISHTTILSLAHIIKVKRTIRTNHHILQQSISLNGIPNIRLLLLRQIDRLGITTTLEVENTIIIPSMFIITNEESLRICRQCSLSSTRQTKEQSTVSILTHIC